MFDPQCKRWLGGKPVQQFPLKAGDRLYLTWVLQKDRRVVRLITDDASLEAIKKEEQGRVAKQVAEEGVAGQVEAVDGTTVQLLIFSTYWAQMRDFKPGQRVRIKATTKAFHPTGDPVELKLVSSKTGGPYGSGPTDVVLEIQRPADAKVVKEWVGPRVVRLLAK